ncbi:MAG: nitrilase-related carbon-nitrogen hydrolase [Bacillota bacterium]
MKRFLHPALISISIASLLGGLCLMFPSLWFFAPISLALFFYTLVKWTRCGIHAFGYGFLFAFVTAASGILWFWDAYPLDWLGIASRTVQWEVLFMTWVMVSAALAIGPALVAVGLWKVRASRFFPLFATVLWVLAEELRMWGFAALTWGAQSFVGPHFSSAALGYAFTENSYLLQLARFGGLPMLNLAVAAFAALFVELVLLRSSHETPRLRLSIGTSAVIALLVLPLIPSHPHLLTSPVRAALVTTQHSGSTLSLEEARAEDVALLAQAGHEHAGLVVFPEGHGLIETLPDAEDRAKTLGELVPGALVMSAGTLHTPEGTRARLTYDTDTDGTLATYDKLFFMPLGEYTPYLALPIFSTLGDGDVTSFLDKRMHGLTRGTDLITVPYLGNIIGGLLCSETVSPYLYHELGKGGANLLVNLSNPVWFRNSHLLYARMLEFGKLHAVQDSAYYLQASNLAPSFAIDPHGQIIAQSAWATTSVMIVDLR